MVLPSTARRRQEYRAIWQWKTIEIVDFKKVAGGHRTGEVADGVALTRNEEQKTNEGQEL